MIKPVEVIKPFYVKVDEQVFFVSCIEDYITHPLDSISEFIKSEKFSIKISSHFFVEGWSNPSTIKHPAVNARKFIESIPNVVERLVIIKDFFKEQKILIYYLANERFGNVLTTKFGFNQVANLYFIDLNDYINNLNNYYQNYVKQQSKPTTRN